MNRNLLTGIAIGVFAGFLTGYFLGASHSSDAMPIVSAPVAAAPVGGTVPMSLPNPLEVQGRIASGEQLVAAEPKNERAWINLGNDYFDAHQAQKSVDAYAKALALNPKNPDVLTDQGIMYRELKAFDKAVACFVQANKLDPKHLQSLFNLGIVYSQDLKKPEEAAKAWKKVIEIDPGSAQANQARQAMAGSGS